jgi:hypothetical protein
MIRRKLTVDDLCKVSGYSRDQIRHLVGHLPSNSEQETEPRKAREFVARDLIVVSILYLLEYEYFMKRSAFPELIEELSRVLAGPRPAYESPLLHLTLVPLGLRYVHGGAPLSPGCVIPLGSIFEKVDAYLSIDEANTQRELELGVYDVSKKRHIGS